MEPRVFVEPTIKSKSIIILSGGSQDASRVISIRGWGGHPDQHLLHWVVNCFAWHDICQPSYIARFSFPFPVLQCIILFSSAVGTQWTFCQPAFLQDYWSAAVADDGLWVWPWFPCFCHQSFQHDGQFALMTLWTPGILDMVHVPFNCLPSTLGEVFKNPSNGNFTLRGLRLAKKLAEIS